MGDLSKNFSTWEFECHCCRDLIINGALPRALQKLRDAIGAPINVHCGYRCPKKNKSLRNASPKSQHMQGTAADIHADGMAHLDLLRAAQQIDEFKVGGLGLYPWGIHVDVRGVKSRWGEIDGKTVSLDEAVRWHQNKEKYHD